MDYLKIINTYDCEKTEVDEVDDNLDKRNVDYWEVNATDDAFPRSI